MLTANNIRASYRNTTILDNINLNIYQGEFAGIIGPNGAGKTTLLKVISGVKKPMNGTVCLDNRDMKTMSRHEIARIMAVVPQSSFVPPLFTVEDVVSIGRYAHSKKRFTTTASDQTAINKALNLTDTDRFRHRYVSELSGGERQEVLIARALAQEPKLLLLDEPTANLDIRHQIKILELIRKLVDSQSLTALMVIHDLNLAARFCTKLILLHNGRVHAAGKADEVITVENLADAYGVSTCIDYNARAGGLQVSAIECLPEKQTSSSQNRRSGSDMEEVS